MTPQRQCSGSSVRSVRANHPGAASRHAFSASARLSKSPRSTMGHFFPSPKMAVMAADHLPFGSGRTSVRRVSSLPFHSMGEVYETGLGGSS